MSKATKYSLAVALALSVPAAMYAQPEAAAASTASMAAPIRMQIEALPTPPVFTPAQLLQQQRGMGITHSSPPIRTQSTAIAGPGGLPMTDALGSAVAGPEAELDPAPLAPDTFRYHVASTLAPLTGSSTINEPSVAQSGRRVFYTGNWYAARSTTSGTGAIPWLYINPYVDMPDFCCDQDVILDRGRDIMLWYRQGVPNGAGNNRFRLGVSSDGGAGFCFYDVTPANVNAGFTNRWFDYPHLALTNNFLYIATNVFTQAGAFDRKLILRFPLDPLKACAGFGYSYANNVIGGWGEPAQGGTNIAYFGDHGGTNNSFTVFSWPENSGTISWVTRAIPAFTFENRDGVCMVGGQNPCGRADSRIQAGWVRKREYDTVGQIGFMWNARHGGGFAYPYIEAVTFREDNLTVTGRPFVWSPSSAWHYPFASPNARGDLGVTMTIMGGAWNPSVFFGLDDDYNGNPPGWQVFQLRAGSASATSWGDYVRNRAFIPSQLGWVSSGHVRNASGAVIPSYFIISRERDWQSVTRWR